MGLPVEVDRVVAALRDCAHLAVVQVDGPYPSRGDSAQVRLYVRALCCTDVVKRVGGASDGRSAAAANTAAGGSS